MPLDPAYMALDDPFTRALDAFLDKITRTEGDFGGTFLNGWIQETFGQALNVMTFDGGDPLDPDPLPSDCPMIQIYGDTGSPWKPHGVGAQTIDFAYAFRGVVYTTDQRVANRFLHLSLSAVFYPMHTPDDPLSSVDEIKRYAPTGPIAPIPLLMVEEAEDRPFFRWEFVAEIEFSGADLPYFKSY